jgi:hypothetical protein
MSIIRDFIEYYRLPSEIKAHLTSFDVSHILLDGYERKYYYALNGSNQYTMLVDMFTADNVRYHRKLFTYDIGFNLLSVSHEYEYGKKRRTDNFTYGSGITLGAVTQVTTDEFDINVSWATPAASTGWPSYNREYTPQTFSAVNSTMQDLSAVTSDSSWVTYLQVNGLSASSIKARMMHISARVCMGQNPDQLLLSAWDVNFRLYAGGTVLDYTATDGHTDLSGSSIVTLFADLVIATGSIPPNVLFQISNPNAQRYLLNSGHRGDPGVPDSTPTALGNFSSKLLVTLT